MCRSASGFERVPVPAISGQCWILRGLRGWWRGNYSREACTQQDSIERSQVRAFVGTDARVTNGRLRSSGDELGTDCVVEILYPAIVASVNFTGFSSCSLICLAVQQALAALVANIIGLSVVSNIDNNLVGPKVQLAHNLAGRSHIHFPFKPIPASTMVFVA